MSYKDKKKAKTYQKRWKLNHPYYHRNYYKNNKEKYIVSAQKEKLLKPYQILARWRKYPKRYKIRRDSRKLFPQHQICSIKNCRNIGERHHPNYTNVNIVWLCKRHHRTLHQYC